MNTNIDRPRPCRPVIALALAGACLTVGFGVAEPAQAAFAAGELDNTFDGDGKLRLPQPPVANEVLVQTDGKILVVGDYGFAGDSDFVVTRLNPDGSIDNTFDGDGTAAADFGGDDRANAAALQPDGKLVVAGVSRSGIEQPAVARFNPDGSLDATFGPDGDGKTLVPPAQRDAIAVVVQHDSRIVLVGHGNSGGIGEIAVTRLTPTGDVDGTVWDRGRFAGTTDPLAAALNPNGKLVVAGRHHPDRVSPAEIALARFGADGKLDTTFGGTGKVTLTSPGGDETPAVLVQPNGKILVAGTTITSGSPEMVVTRFNPDGTPDTSWGAGGRAFAGFDGSSASTAAALQPDGKVVVTGIAIAGFDMAVARFNRDGTLDPSFGTSGRTTVDFGSFDIAWAIALQHDHRIILAGQTATGAAVARLLGGPPPPPS